jgi:hypothetical protein
MHGSGQIKGNLRLATTTDSQRYTEIPEILQFLLSIHQRLLLHHTTIVQFNKERNSMELDNRM